MIRLQTSPEVAYSLHFLLVPSMYSIYVPFLSFSFPLPLCVSTSVMVVLQLPYRQ